MNEWMYFILCVCVYCAQSCTTLCNSINWSPQVSSVHIIFQARILEWVAISYSRGSSQSRDWTHASCISGIGKLILYHWVTWNLIGELEAHTRLYLCFLFPLNVTKWRKVWSILKRFSFQFLHHFYDIYFAHISIMKPYEYINILIEIKPTILGNTWKTKILLTVFCRIAICKTPSSSDISTDTGKINTEWRAEVQCLNWSCAAKQYFPVCSCSWSVISVTSNSL